MTCSALIEHNRRHIARESGSGLIGGAGLKARHYPGDDKACDENSKKPFHPFSPFPGFAAHGFGRLLVLLLPATSPHSLTRRAGPACLACSRSTQSSSLPRSADP